MSASVLEKTLTPAQVLLLKTLNRIIEVARHPEAHEMGWRQADWVTVDENHCGTAMCFAGWACAIEGRRIVIDTDDEAHVMDPLLLPELSDPEPFLVDSIHADLVEREAEDLMPDVDEAAAALLDLQYIGKWALFDACNTLDDLKVIVSRLIQGKEVRHVMWSQSEGWAREDLYGDDVRIVDELLQRPEVQV